MDKKLKSMLFFTYFMWETEIKNNLFDYYPPQSSFIGIVSIPHSGEILPDDFKPYLDSNFAHLAQDVDYKVHELVDIKKLQDAGIAVLKAHIIRTAVDLNRSKATTLLNWKKNSKGVQIVTTEPDQETAHLLVEKFYSPYYEMLRTLINELGSYQKKQSIVDLHSMPGKAEEYHMKQNPNQDPIRPDFCLSDHLKESCEPSFIESYINNLKKHYSDVRYNDPYIGGYITQYIQEQYPNCNNIQIEINRSLYMDETNKGLKKDAVAFMRRALTDSLIASFQEFA